MKTPLAPIVAGSLSCFLVAGAVAVAPASGASPSPAARASAAPAPLDGSPSPALAADEVPSSPLPVAGDDSAVAAIVSNAVSDLKLCSLALEKSHDPDVQTMCRTASAVNARTAIAGMQLAQRRGATGVTLAESTDTARVLDSLLQYSGRDFDRAFLLAKIVDDSNDENAIRYAVEFAADLSVKRYEKSVLPTIQIQLERAEGALRRVSETTEP